MRSGEEQAWEILSGLAPEETCVRTGAAAVEGGYRLPCFGQDLLVRPGERTFSSDTRLGRFILDDLARYSRLATVWYLVRAKNLPLSGRLITPRELPGGDIYLKGTHVLPLASLAERYGHNPAAFLDKGGQLGGRPAEYGDASVELAPFPHIGMALLLWRGDDEFAARADLLLDSSCAAQLPPDIIWSTAMMAVLLFLPGANVPCVP